MAYLNGTCQYHSFVLLTQISFLSLLYYLVLLGTQDPRHFRFLMALATHTPYKNTPTSSVHLLLSAGIRFTEGLLTASQLKAYIAICWPLLTVQVSTEIVTSYISTCLQLKLQKNEFLHLVTQFSTLTEYLQYICCLPLSSQQLPAGSTEDHPLQDLCLRDSHLSGMLTSSHQKLIYLLQMTQKRNLDLFSSPWSRFKIQIGCPFQ